MLVSFAFTIIMITEMIELLLLTFLFSKFLGSIPGLSLSKIPSCRVNTTSRWGIKQLGTSFSSIFLLFSFESSQGRCS